MGWGEALQGAGAWMSGNGPQYMAAQQMQERTKIEQEEARRLANFQDNRMLLGSLAGGNIDMAKQVLQQRIAALKQSGGDTSHSEYALGLANGGPKELQQLATEAMQFDQIGVMSGILKPMGGEQGMASAKTRQYVDGTVQMVMPDGSIQVVLPDGQQVHGEDARAALQQAMANEVNYAGQKSGAMAQAQQGAQYQYAAPIAGAQAQARADVEAATAPQIAAATTQAQEGAKADVERDTQARVSAKAGDTLELSSNQVIDAFSKVNSGPIWGRIPAAMRDSTAYQTAEAAAGGYRAQMRKIVRPPGSGPWTDVDEQKLDAIVPNLTDTRETVAAKLKQGQELYDAQMGKPQGGTPNPLEGKTIVNPQTKERMVMRNGQWVPL